MGRREYQDSFFCFFFYEFSEKNEDVVDWNDRADGLRECNAIESAEI